MSPETQSKQDRRRWEIDDPQGGRNKLRAGDPVRVSKGGADKTGYRARFQYADYDEEGRITSITVFGGRQYDPALPVRGQYQKAPAPTLRTVRAERVSRMQRKAQRP